MTASPRTVALVFAYRYPGKYAFNVLAGALAAEEEKGGLHLLFATDREQMLAHARQALDAGHHTALLWSFYSPGLPEAAEDLAWIRSQLAEREFLAIAGGVHATGETEETLRSGFDWAAVGEGERTILELVARMRADETFDGVKGLARLADGRVLHGGKGELIELDDYPAFAPKHRKFGAIEITRGCIYACRFCQTPFMSKARFRHRSIANVAHWARVLRESGLRDVRFISPTSLSYGSPGEEVNLAAVDELLAKVREAMGPDGRVFFGTFPSEVRPEHVTHEALAVLKKWVDNDNLIIGGQSGSVRVLESSHRGHDVETIERAARIAIEAGFKPNVDFILGLPGEEESDVESTLQLMDRLSGVGARVHGHTFMPLPGTPFKNAPPGRIDDATRVRLDQMASKGELYGGWKQQVAVAQDLAVRRDKLVQLRKGR